VPHDLDLLIRSGDVDGLVRLIDALCASRDWETLLEVRDSCRAATDAGRQVWPAATLADYRLALRAPDELAAIVVDESNGRFVLGPLSEVVAQHHRWEDLAPHLEDPVAAEFVARECALRGQRTGHQPLDPYDVPVDPLGWEPAYALATYRDDGADFPHPAVSASGWQRVVGAAGTAVTGSAVDGAVSAAVHDLVSGWTTGSNGTWAVSQADHVDGAVAALAGDGAQCAAIGSGDAMALAAWAGASGGAHGRRRGAAGGRQRAWALVAATADLDLPWSPDAIGRAADDATWWTWDDASAPSGWTLRLAWSTPRGAWAIDARDRTDDPA
jgi:hypothetical protein